MSDDFWAGYISGAGGIIVGNPLDVLKVRLQTGATVSLSKLNSIPTLFSGTAAPILGYGGLNALLFVSYNRSEVLLNRCMSTNHSLWATWLAGAAGGLSTWVISTPTELIKCRAQASAVPPSSLRIAKEMVARKGIRGLYIGGSITAVRDSVGYGFYFWTYELANAAWSAKADSTLHQKALRTLICGGVAGVATWASVFPLDVIKTRLQTQARPLRIGTGETLNAVGALEVARAAYAEEGSRIFFRGLTVCSLRAFIVNAVQWAVYEGIMDSLGHGRRERDVKNHDKEASLS